MAHDDKACEAKRLRGWVCNKPHASNDPMGAKQPMVKR